MNTPQISGILTNQTLVSWTIESEDGNTMVISPVLFNKPPTDITLLDIKQCYNGPPGVFMFKTLDEDADDHFLYPTDDDRYHWTILTENHQFVPCYGNSGIIIKVRPVNLRMSPILDERDLPFTVITPPKEANKKREPSTVYACTYPDCDKSFNKPWRLKSHLRNHTGEKKPHACTFEGCGKTFNESGALKNHLRVHTGEKPFGCPHEGCGKRFTEKGNLRKHLRLHSGEKPYMCTYAGCGKSYGRSDQLKVHLAEHSGIKPFACTVSGCDKTFSYSSGLKVHMRVHEKPDQ